MVDPVFRESALERCKDSGYRAGVWGSPSTVNPFTNKSSMREEFDKWASGHSEGYAEWKRRNGK